MIYTNVSDALNVFDQAKEAAGKGGSAVGAAVSGMQVINQNSKQIGNILNVITEIANQTNLLSLNAAIEAGSTARASPWWPRKCASWPSAAPRPPRRSPR